MSRRFFEGEVSAASPFNSAPYQLGLADLTRTYSSTQRRAELLLALKDLLTALSKEGIQVKFLLGGGSFFDELQEDPKDIDCLIFYVAQPGANFAAANAACRLALVSGIDSRMVPVDSEPMLPIKMAAFFTMLYSIDRLDPAVRRASYLISID